MNVDIPMYKLELVSVLSKESTLEMKTEMLTEEFRLLVYKPWNLIVRVGFVSGSAVLNSSGVIDKVLDVLQLELFSTSIVIVSEELPGAKTPEMVLLDELYVESLVVNL